MSESVGKREKGIQERKIKLPIWGAGGCAVENSTEYTLSCSS